MEWRGSQHAVSAESPGKSRVPPCTGHLPLCHQHGTLFCSPQKDRLWIWYIKKGRGGESKMKGVVSHYQQLGRVVSGRANICPVKLAMLCDGPYLPRCLLVRCGLCERSGQWGGGGSDYVLLLNWNWNETKHFQLSPDPPSRAADLALPGHPQTLATPTPSKNHP